MQAAAATQSDWVYDPLPTQKRFHADLFTRFKGYSGPVGSGKSYALAYEAVFMAMLNPGRWGLLGAPTFPVLRDTTKRAFTETLEIEGIPFIPRGTDNAIILPDPPFYGSRILFRSMNEYERLRGTNLAWFGVDELTYCPKEAWQRLMGRLRDKEANRLEGFAAWTPKGYDWVYETFIDKPKENYKAYLASPRENFHVDQTGMYDTLAATYDERFYQQEVLGLYLNVFTGQVYYAFHREHNVRNLIWDLNRPIVWSLDFNINPMCSVIGQVIDNSAYVHMLTGQRDVYINVLEELVIQRSNTLEACEEFNERMSTFLPGRQITVTVYGDASGSSGKTLVSGSGAKSDWEEVRRFFDRNKHRYRAIFKLNQQNPPVKERTDAMNGGLCSHDGTRKIFINKKCAKLIRDLERVSWKPDTRQIDKDSDAELTHLSDALGYMVHMEMGIAQPGGYKTSPIFSYA